MVTITASHIVIPEESTPQGRLWLSDIDQVVRVFHTNSIYIYKPEKNIENAIETLKNSLSKTLVHYYPVAGRYFNTEGGRLEVNLNAKGAILLEAETTKTIHDYGDFSPSDSTMELVPIIDYNQPIEDIPLFVAQLTRFQNKDEGLAIGIANSHPIHDGLGATKFINSWAKIARGETLEANELPFIDRTILKFSHTPSKPRFEHIELKPLPLILGRTDTSEEKMKKTSATLLKLSPEQVDKLKKKANEGDIFAMKKKGSRPFSRYEAISAHIWRCASKARELEENQESVVRFNADIRTRMIPPLPKTYFGNALAQTAAKGYIGEITSKPLGYVSQMIREAIEIVSDEYIRSQIDIIRGFEHLDDARKLFLGGEGKNFPYFGNPNFHFTSWMSMPIYEADFGWGKPVYFGLAKLYPHDRALILLSHDGDGSVLVCLHFQIACLELFKKFFYGDI